MKHLLLIVPLLAASPVALAQAPAIESYGQTNTVQPRIMVVPFTKEGEDIRTVLDADANRRIAITKVKEAFDNRGFSTVDFVGRLKAANDNKVFTSENQDDIKSQLIQSSGADMYVQVEVVAQPGASGNSVNVILSAYEAAGGNSLANKVGSSGKFFTDDYGKLTSKAVEACGADMMNTLQTKFTDIVNNGRSVLIDISFGQESAYKMSSVIKGQDLPFSDVLEEWLSKNAYKNNYHIQGTTDLRMICDDVRIPLRDQATGKNYNANRFALELFKYLKSIGLEPAKDVKGNTIYITIK